MTPTAAVLPIIELGVAAGLLLGTTAVGGAVGALVLLGLFTAGIIVSRSGGRQPDCRCFGQLHSAPVGWKTLLRNAALAGVAVLVVAEGPGTSLGTWPLGLSGIEWVALAVAVALTVAFVLEGSLLIDRWRQNGRLRARTDALEAGSAGGTGPAHAVSDHPVPSRADMGTAGTGIVRTSAAGRRPETVIPATSARSPSGRPEHEDPAGRSRSTGRRDPSDP